MHAIEDGPIDERDKFPAGVEVASTQAPVSSLVFQRGIVLSKICRLSVATGLKAEQDKKQNEE